MRLTQPKTNERKHKKQRSRLGRIHPKKTLPNRDTNNTYSVSVSENNRTTATPLRADSSPSSFISEQAKNATPLWRDNGKSLSSYVSQELPCVLHSPLVQSKKLNLPLTIRRLEKAWDMVIVPALNFFENIIKEALI